MSTHPFYMAVPQTWGLQIGGEVMNFEVHMTKSKTIEKMKDWLMHQYIDTLLKTEIKSIK